MTRDVLICVTGVHFVDGVPQEVEMITTGDYFLKNGKHYVLYDEILEEGGEAVKTTIRLTSDSMEIRRRGQTESHMVFERGKENVSRYATPVGELMVGIRTGEIRVEEAEDILTAEAVYALDVNFEHVSDCSITVSVRSK